MPHIVARLELAQRLRRDAKTACMPEYAVLMQRAAEEIEAFARLADAAADSRERCAA